MRDDEPGDMNIWHVGEEGEHAQGERLLLGRHLVGHCQIPNCQSSERMADRGHSELSGKKIQRRRKLQLSYSGPPSLSVKFYASLPC